MEDLPPFFRQTPVTDGHAAIERDAEEEWT